VLHLSCIYICLTRSKCIEAFVSIADERQRHLCIHIIALGCGLCAERCSVVRLWNLIDGEILSIDVACESGLKGSTNAPEAVPLNTVEERVRFDFVGTADPAETVVHVADETSKRKLIGLGTP
jgi:ferredoxin